MDLSHTFTVPTGVEETWSHFQDIASLAQCFPGATVTEADEESFAGTVKVKLGPIAMLYKGQGVFTERDHDAHAFKVDASGKDKRGNGTAGAKVTLTMVEGAGGSTQVQVVTDLNVTGKPAQFGRGVMQDVSDKLLAQFVSCLEQRLSDSEPEAATVGESDPQAVAADQTVTAAQPEPPSGDQAVAPAATPIADAAASAGPTGPVAGSSRPAPAAAPRRTPPPAEAEALDLGAAVVPILLKSYWKPVAGVVAALVVVRWLLGRR